MAKATDRIVTKTRTKTVEEKYTEKDGLTLELSGEEAEYLMAVLGWKIVGENGSLRTLNRDIHDAMYYKGYTRSQRPGISRKASLMEGQIRVQGDKPADPFADILRSM